MVDATHQCDGQPTLGLLSGESAAWPGPNVAPVSRCTHAPPAQIGWSQFTDRPGRSRIGCANHRYTPIRARRRPGPARMPRDGPYDARRSDLPTTTGTVPATARNAAASGVGGSRSGTISP